MYLVYKHTNKFNNKVYIGITSKTLEQRWRGRYESNKHFTSAIKKYGKDGFTHEILAQDLTKEEAEKLERYYISFYDSTNQKKGYNIELGGNHNGKHSDATKKKISQSQKGRPLTEEHKQKLRKPKKFHFTDEQRKKRSLRMLGNQYTKGRKHTEEQKRKISEGNKGKHGKAVICSDGNIFNSVYDAASYYNLPRHTIMNMCNGKTAKSYLTTLRFQYKEDEENG